MKWEEKLIKDHEQWVQDVKISVISPKKAPAAQYTLSPREFSVPNSPKSFKPSAPISPRSSPPVEQKSDILEADYKLDVDQVKKLNEKPPPLPSDFAVPPFDAIAKVILY